MSNASEVSLIWKEESVFGTAPSGTYQALNFTSESLRQDTTIVNSQTIRSDRQLASIKRTDLRAAGSFDFELQYGGYDGLFEAGLLSAVWTAAPADTGSMSLDSASGDNSFNRAADSFVVDGFVAGQWVKTSGFATAANNGYFKIVTVTALKMVVSGGTLTTDANAAGRQILQGAEVTQGTTFRSLAVEKQFTDLTNKYALFTGMAIDGISLSANIGQICTGSFEFLGAQEASTAATAGDGSPTAAATTDIMSAVDDVAAILEAQAAGTGFLQWTMQLRNNLRARTEIGTYGVASIGTGTIEITGTLQQYFTTEALFDKYLDQTLSSLAVRFTDTAGNAYIVDLPEVRYSAGQRPAQGQSTDVIADLQYSAFMDPTLSDTIKIARWAA